MTTITTNAGTVITPALVLGYSSARQPGTIIRQVLGGGVDALVQPAKPRTGTLELLFLTEAEAKAAEDLHASAFFFTLADADLSSVGMRYVLAGEVRRELHEDRIRWLLTVPFQEVPA